jgi:hypothetical protein
LAELNAIFPEPGVGGRVDVGVGATCGVELGVRGVGLGMTGAELGTTGTGLAATGIGLGTTSVGIGATAVKVGIWATALVAGGAKDEGATMTCIDFSIVMSAFLAFRVNTGILSVTT